MTPEEEEFKKRLDSVGADAVSCVTHAYQELAFHNVAGSDLDVFQAINSRAGFFNAALAGHQTAMFAALHRVYETDADHESLASLLHYAQNNRQIFTRDALKLRRIEIGMEPNIADQFVANAFEPGETGFAAVRATCAEARILYEQRARPIRHQVFAHTGRLPLTQRVRLFENLMVRDLERLTVLPYIVHRAMQSLFDNGYALNLTMPVTIIGDVVNNPPPEGQAWCLHFHVARHTRDFLRDFTRMYRLDREESGD